MRPKRSKNYARILLFYVLFGIAVTFAATILMIGIYQEIFQLIPMSLVIGVLIWMAFRAFSSRMVKEMSDTEGRQASWKPKEKRGNAQEELAPPDEK